VPANRVSAQFSPQSSGASTTFQDPIGTVVRDRDPPICDFFQKQKSENSARRGGIFGSRSSAPGLI
jgi:hypothetical protein